MRSKQNASAKCPVLQEMPWTRLKHNVARALLTINLSYVLAFSRLGDRSNADIEVSSTCWVDDTAVRTWQGSTTLWTTIRLQGSWNQKARKFKAWTLQNIYHFVWYSILEQRATWPRRFQGTRLKTAREARQELASWLLMRNAYPIVGKSTYAYVRVTPL